MSLYKNPSFAQNRQGISLSRFQINVLGINPKSFEIKDKIEDLRKNPPNMVVGRTLAKIPFSQNTGPLQTLKKRENYVMSLGVYNQLEKNPYTKKRMIKPGPKFSNSYRPYRGEDLSGKKLMVWRTGGIGDLLFIQPNLRYLKELYPDCFIKLACANQYWPMVETWKGYCFDELLELPFHFSHLVTSDYHVIFEGVIERCKEAEKVNSYILFGKWMGLELPEEKLQTWLPVKEDKELEVRQVLENWNLQPEEFIGVQMRSSSPCRTPSYSFWTKLLEKVLQEGYKLVFIDMSQMATQIETFIKSMLPDYKEQCFNFAEYSNSLDSAIALCSLSKGIISTDSSMIHISNALDVPVFGIYGAFKAEVRMSTFKNADWIEPPKESCEYLPCFLHGNNPCKNSYAGGFSRCYESLDFDLAVEKITKLFSRR